MYRHRRSGFLRSSDLAETQIDLRTNRLMETRLLVRRESGWDAFPYVWNEEQTEAFLRVAGASRPVNLESDAGTLDFVYFVLPTRISVPAAIPHNIPMEICIHWARSRNNWPHRFTTPTATGTGGLSDLICHRRPADSRPAVRAAGWRGTSVAKSQNSKSVSLCSITTPLFDSDCVNPTFATRGGANS